MNTSSNPQGVGINYKQADYLKAQEKGWQLLNALKAKIQPGLTELEARKIYTELMKLFGIKKNWHPPKIRFGPNTTKSFSELSNEDYILKSNDICFIDLGAIIDGYESDNGQTFTVGNQIPESFEKIISDSQEIFKLTKNQFLKNNLNGPGLYAFAEQEAKNKGWNLVGEGANGHRVGDFPHHVFFKGNLRSFEPQLIPGLWILEIQLQSPDLKFGAFFEDVLI